MIYYAHSYQTLFLLSDRRLKIDVFIKDREEHFHSHHFIANCWQVPDGIRVLYQDIFLENTILQNLDPHKKCEYVFFLFRIDKGYGNLVLHLL